MSREDIEKLLGGYATGTLTPQEREALFAAALEDQHLFDTLAREEPLRDVLQSPGAKTRLLAALEGTRTPWYRGWPRPLSLAAAVAGMALVIWVVVERPGMHRPQTLAVVRLPKPLLPEPLPSPLPQALEKRALPPAPRAAEVSLKEALAPPSPVAPQAAPLAAPPAPVSQTAAAPPPPAAPPAAEKSAVTALPVLPLPAAPRSAAAGLQFTPAAGAIAGVGGMVSLRDAPSLYYGGAPVVSNNLFNANAPGPAQPRARGATVVDAISKTSAAHLGVRYTVLRREAGGGFAEVNPGQELDAEDQFVLRLQPNDAGYLYVFQRGAGGAWNLLAGDPVPRLAMHQVPASGALTFGDSSVQEFFVLFSRQPLTPPERILTVRDNQARAGNPPERAIYVASTVEDPAAQRIGFPITVRRK